MAARNPPASAEAEAPAAPKKSKALLIIGIVVGVIALVGASAGTAWWVASRHASEASDEDEPKAKPAKGEKPEKGKKKDKEKEADRKPPVFVPMEPYTVNLRSAGRERFLQVTFVLQATDTPAADAAKAQMPAIRSHVLLLLASKGAEELATPEGKDKLAAEVLALVTQPAESAPPVKGIERVLFSSFIVQ